MALPYGYTHGGAKLWPRPSRPWADDDDYAGPVKIAAAALENDVLGRALPGYVDAWPALRGNEPGHTFDGETNPHVADADECMRYDRVMSRGAEVLTIRMLGVRGEASPSDHYGLEAELALI